MSEHQKIIEYQNAFFQQVVLTKYHGILCRKCYGEEFEEAKSIFFEFLANFEVEYDTDFEGDLEKLSDVFERIHDFYEGCSYRLENEEPKEEHKEIVRILKRLRTAKIFTLFLNQSFNC